MKIKKERLLQIIEEELEADAKNSQPLDEGAMDVIGNVFMNLPSGMLQNFKGWLARKVMSWIGIERGGIAFDVIINHLEDWTAGDVASLVSGAGGKDCYVKTSGLSKALLESMLERIPEVMGIDLTGIFMGSLREAMVDTVLGDINKSIASSICNIDPEKELGIKLNMGLKEAQAAFSERFGDNASILEEKEKRIQG